MITQENDVLYYNNDLDKFLDLFLDVDLDFCSDQRLGRAAHVVVNNVKKEQKDFSKVTNNFSFDVKAVLSSFGVENSRIESLVTKQSNSLCCLLQNNPRQPPFNLDECLTPSEPHFKTRTQCKSDELMEHFSSKHTNKRLHKISTNNNIISKTYVEPCASDVLFGRGGRTNHHPGNKKFLLETQKLYPTYLAALRTEKIKVSKKLVQIVKEWGGRFIKKEEEEEDESTASVDDGSNNNEKKEKWYEVNDVDARKKASQALRECQYKHRQQS